MSEKVCCKETKVPCTYEMTDRDFLNDILCSEKEITKNMVTALTEASNLNLYDELYRIFDIVRGLQRAVYELAWNKGWYTLENITKTKQEQTLTNLNKRLQEFE